MKIDKILKIQKKYFDAILKLQKPFEIRHSKVKEGAIVKLEEILTCKDLEKAKNCNLLSHGSCAGCCLSDVDYESSGGACKPGNNKTGRYIIFKAGKAEKINVVETIMTDPKWNQSMTIIQNEANSEFIKVDFECGATYKKGESWYDEFCWKYIQEKDSYIIPIKEFIEIKNNEL